MLIIESVEAADKDGGIGFIGRTLTPGMSICLLDPVSTWTPSKGEMVSQRMAGLLAPEERGVDVARLNNVTLDRFIKDFLPDLFMQDF